MANLPMARCGIDCDTCAYREQTGCPGCQSSKGKLFWGECALALCSIAKEKEHCGQCEEFPCNLLNEYAYDPEQGDGGERIRNLQAWREQQAQA